MDVEVDLVMSPMQDTRCAARGEEGTPDSNDKVKRGKVARCAVRGEEGTPDYRHKEQQA